MSDLYAEDLHLVCSRYAQASCSSRPRVRDVSYLSPLTHTDALWLSFQVMNTLMRAIWADMRAHRISVLSDTCRKSCWARAEHCRTGCDSTYPVASCLPSLYLTGRWCGTDEPRSPMEGGSAHTHSLTHYIKPSDSVSQCVLNYSHQQLWCCRSHCPGNSWGGGGGWSVMLKACWDVMTAYVVFIETLRAFLDSAELCIIVCAVKKAYMFYFTGL